MRWRPVDPVCQECGFDWWSDRRTCVDLVARVHIDAVTALTAVAHPRRQPGRRWSASMYVWHLVDVLRIGAERLLTLRLDPERRIPCWDENLLAEARRYAQLSPVVGLAALDLAAQQWVHTAETTPDAEVEHPLFGTLTTLDVVRRNAHEVRHHLHDIQSSDAFPPDR